MTAHMHRAENRVQHEHTLISICCICIFHIGYASCPTPVTHLTRTIPQPWMLFAISLNFHTVVLFLSPQESLQMTLFKALMAEQCLQSVMWRARGPRRGICANLPSPAPALHCLLSARSWARALGRAEPVWAIDIEYPWSRSQDLGGIHHCGCLQAGWSQGTCLSS